MADPLSIASGVAGPITLADVVIERTYKTIVTCKNAGKDAQRLLREVQSLLGILKSLHVLELQVNNNAVFRTKIPPDQLHYCQTTLEKLRNKLQLGDTNSAASKLEKAWRTLKWPFTSAETDEILAQIERYKSTFDLTVSMDTLEAMLMTQPALDSVADDIAEIKQSLYRMEMTSSREAMFEFFGAFDAETNYNQGRKSRHSGTGLWLIESEELKTWMAERNARIWLHGIPGAGKTVLASAVIEESMRAASTSVGVAFYFCDYKTPKKRVLCNIVACLIGQLARQDSRCLTLLQNCYKPGTDARPRHDLPDTDSLIQLLQKMSSCFTDVMLVVDALDESFEPSNVSETLREVVMTDNSNIKIALLSRDELEIKVHLMDFVHVSIKARSSDLRLYVSSEIEERTRQRRLRIRSSELKDEILERLIDGADGMFRWVSCQLDHLCELPSDAARRKALNTLPPTLYETYSRLFQRISLLPEASRDLVQRTLHWLIGAPKLDSNQLCEAVSISDGDEAIDPLAIPDVEEILYRCSSLVRLSVDSDSVELAHFTVEEYLCGPALTSDPQLARFHYSAKEANSRKVRTCLTCVTMDQLGVIARKNEQLDEKCDAHPFYKVASLSWHNLLPEDELGPQEWRLVHKLFAPQKTTHFQAWAQIEVEERNKYETLSLVDSNLGPCFNPLHFACILGYSTLAKWLIEQGCDIDELCIGIGVPLHCALLGFDILKLPKEVDSQMSFLNRLWRKDFPENHEKVTRLLYKSGANLAIPLSGPGQLHDCPLIALACLNNVDAIFTDAGAFVDSSILAFLTGLEDTGLRILPLDELLACLQIENLSNLDKQIFTRLSMYTKTIAPSTLEGLSNSKVSPEVLALQKRAFLTACKGNDVGIVEQLYDRYNFQLDELHEDDKLSGMTPFLWAAQRQANNVVAYLLQQGVDPNQTCSLGRNAIHHCLSRSYRDIDTLRILLEANVSYNSPDSHGDFAVHICVEKTTTEDELRVLLDHGADLSPLDSKNRSALCLAARHDQLSMYKLLHKKLSKEEFAREMLRKNLYGQNPLHVAAISGRTVFRKMVNDQVRLTTRASDGRNIWHFAATSTGYGEKTLQFVPEIVPIVTSYDGCTPMHDLVTAICDCLEESGPSMEDVEAACKTLSRMHVDLAAIGTSGKTALHVLCQTLRDHPSLRHTSRKKLGWMIEWSVDEGANPLCVAGTGETCLDICVDAIAEKPKFYWNVLEHILQQVPDDKLLSYRKDGTTLLAWAADRSLDELCYYLLEKKADPDERGEINAATRLDDEYMLTPLETLCWNGCGEEVIQKALQLTQRLHELSQDGNSLLHLAVLAEENGHAIVLLLLQFGLEVNVGGTKRYAGRTALMIAAQGNDSLVVQELLKHGADPNRVDKHSATALAYACENGCVEAVKLLAGITSANSALEVDLETHRDVQLGHLGLAAFYGYDEILVELLAHSHPDGSDQAISALWIACFEGHVELVRLLLDSGYDIEATDSWWGFTPLHAAAYNGHVQIVRHLLQLGCRTDLQDRYGRIPIFYAIQGEHSNTVQELRTLRRSKVGEFCSDTRPGAGPQAMIGLGEESLLKMVHRGDVSTLELFQASGWDIDAVVDCGNCTPLMIAISCAQHAVSQFLLDHGASLDARGCYQHQANVTPGHLSCRASNRASILEAILSNPRCSKMYLIAEFFNTEAGSFLHEAARYGNAEGIAILLDHGANPVAQNKYLQTPLHLAAEYGSFEGVSFLLQAGASVNMYDDSIRSPSDIAIFRGHETVLKILYEKRKIPFHNGGCRTSPMLDAAESGSVGVIRYLIVEGENIDVRNLESFCALSSLIDAGGTATTFALNSGFHLDSVDLLWPPYGADNRIERKTYRRTVMRYDRRRVIVDINARQNPSRPGKPTTPLMMVSAAGDEQAVNQLMAHGALINLEGAREGTPLMAACTYGRLHVVKALVEFGARLAYTKNGMVFSAVHAAKPFPRIARWLLVDRLCEQRLLLSCSTLALDQDFTVVDVPKLNLDLVFMEDWEDHVNTKLMPPSKKRFIGRMDGDAGFVEETTA